jgi:carboxyl-terminal processing protease
VLVNKYTASAAELFASAIRDYKYGTLIGTNTYGKGTAQSIKKFPDNSALFISTELYMPPYGENYEGKGILPDVVLEYEAGAGGREDSQTQKAIDILLDLMKAEEDIE